MDLIQWLQKYLQSGGTSVVPSGGNAVANPGTAVTRWHPTVIDGEWSDPKLLTGPNGGVSPYVHNGDIRPPQSGGEE